MVCISVNKYGYKTINVEYSQKLAPLTASRADDTEDTGNLDNVCKDYNFLHAIYIVKNFITVAKVAVPLILIILVIIDVARAMIKTDETPSVVKIGGKRLLIALLVFLVPTLIDMVVELASKDAQSDWIACYNNASNYEDYKKVVDEQKVTEEESYFAKLRELISNQILESKKRAEETKKTDVARDTEFISAQEIAADGSNYVQIADKINTPTMEQLEQAATKNDIGSESLKVILATTYNEGYSDDPYLSYGWACAMIYNKDTYTVDYMSSHWGSFYSWNGVGGAGNGVNGKGGITPSYNYMVENQSNSIVVSAMKAVYLALVARNTSIYSTYGGKGEMPASDMIYESSIHNCQIYAHQ